MVACNWDEFKKDVSNGLPRNSISESSVKFSPSTVTTNSASPGVKPVVSYFNLVIVGLGAAIFSSDASAWIKPAPDFESKPGSCISKAASLSTFLTESGWYFSPK